MARYGRLLAVEVTHEYLDHGAVLGLRYVPTFGTAALMEREGLLLRSLPYGVELWQEQHEQHGPQGGDAEVWQLSFDVYGGDATLRFCTEWPQHGFLAVAPGAQDTVKVWRAVAQQAPMGDGRSPVLWIDLACQLLPAQLADAAVASAEAGMASAATAQTQAGQVAHVAASGVVAATASQPVLPWRFALQSKKIHWKYFFSGGLAAKQLSIIDLDASDNEPGLGFAPSPLAATANGTAYLSASPVPMQSIPQQRLQLREAGAAGKVLIRRLPNASVDKLGKERGPNGQSMIVAEIYVHQ
jgi:hypothetical protein